MFTPCKMRGDCPGKYLQREISGSPSTGIDIDRIDVHGLTLYCWWYNSLFREAIFTSRRRNKCKIVVAASALCAVNSTVHPAYTGHFVGKIVQLTTMSYTRLYRC